MYSIFNQSTVFETLFGRSFYTSNLRDGIIGSLRNLCVMLSNRVDMGSRDNNRDMDMLWSRKMNMISRGNNHRGMNMVSSSNHSWAESTSFRRSSTSLIRPGIVGESL